MARDRKYEPLSEMDVEEQEEHRLQQRWPSPLQDKWMVVVPWVLFGGMVVLYLTHWLSPRAECPECFNDRLLNAPIEWVEKTYYSDLDGFKPDIYSMRNPNHKEEWKKIQDIGITIITEEEKSRLPGHRNTATFRGTESQGEGYVVHLEAFHQLHCLKALRGAFYGDWEELRQYEDPDFHADHCWSYLVQTTICHADVAVMPTFWMDWSHDYKAYFNITRQCRNFEKIAEWARTRKPKCDEEGKATLDRILAKGLITPGTGKCTP